MISNYVRTNLSKKLSHCLENRKDSKSYFSFFDLLSLINFIQWERKKWQKNLQLLKELSRLRITECKA
jgi:hypothetical protein